MHGFRKVKGVSISRPFRDTTEKSGESNRSLILAAMIAVAVLAMGATAQAQMDESMTDEEWEAPQGDQVEFDEPIIMRSDISGATGGQKTVLELKIEGGAMLVAAQIGGEEVYLVLDTGATYTALTSEFARKVAIYPHSRAPKARVRTAGGMRRVQFGLIRDLRLGDQRLHGVSYMICDECAGESEVDGRPVVGLLGRNVLDRYRVSVDSAGKEVELERQDNFEDQSADIEPWLRVRIGTPEDLSSAPPLKIENRARRSIQELEMEMECETVTGERETIRARPGRIRARSSEQVALEERLMGCRSVEWRVDAGRW